MYTFTIITSALNALPMLKFTASSIFQQSTSDWQWIIVDGASEDGTKDWLCQITKSRPNVVFISEPDRGIYDAWNKALPMVQGEWTIFLGAGDKLKNSTILETCIQNLENVSVNINLAYGYIEYINHFTDKAGRPSEAEWEGIDGSWAWCRPVLPNHQAVFHRKKLFFEKGGFDTSYKFAGDTAMILPELMRNGAAKLPLCITLRMLDGASLKPKNRVKVLCEVMKINRNVGLGSKRILYQYAAFFYHATKSWLVKICQ
ncbi:MAG: glycosyltransferase [Desulfobulbaceae bacterium]